MSVSTAAARPSLFLGSTAASTSSLNQQLAQHSVVGTTANTFGPPTPATQLSTTVATTASSSLGSTIANTTAAATSAPKKVAGLQFSWVHFIAGGTGGMAGALVTSPLDVVKTRLQSSLYQTAKEVQVPRTGIAAVAGHVKDTCLLLGRIYSHEGPKALYKGLGPNLVGVIPARAINFATYGNGKKFYTDMNGGKETTMVHLAAAATAGVVTATATNPIWLIKTRMQLQVEGVRQYKNSLDCIVQVMRSEGIRGMYKGLSASYLGVAEGTIQWVIYEQLKSTLAERRRLQNLERGVGHGYLVGGKDIEEWVDYLGAAGAAKFVASLITYPHEVLRTRLRQTPPPGEAPKYTGLKRTFQLVLKEEGVAALYGGMTAHMMRVVPNAAIMFFCYEAIMHRFG